MYRFRFLAVIIVSVLVLGGASVLMPAPAFAGGITCSANPSTVVVGSVIQIECSGFVPNSIANIYDVDSTGFSETGRSNYTGCIVGANSNTRGSAKVNEAGIAHFVWYTQNGVNTCPDSNYTGYANQLGAYTVVVQSLDGKGNINYAGTVSVTLTGNGKTYSGAILSTDGPGISGDWLTVYGAGFAPNEYVSIWFTRPGDCAGQGSSYWSGMSAFSANLWSIGGVTGQDSVKADDSGAFSALYQLVGSDHAAYPCLGTWHVTANAVGSGVGAETSFVLNGNRVTQNALVWTAEDRVPSSAVDAIEGIRVHVYGSGFPAGERVTCWFTRPDGTVYNNYSNSHLAPATLIIAADGTFSGVQTTATGEIGYQGDQPGTWAVTCGTLDGKYAGIAHFVVYPLPLIDP